MEIKHLASKPSKFTITYPSIWMPKLSSTVSLKSFPLPLWKAAFNLLSKYPLFDKYKSQNPVNMVKIAQKLLNYVSTNMDNSEIVQYV